ncbi:MAG: YihY/virulence factor BrkB family protein [Prevotella sp.]|nr:YihY/virulence factor BrkB family protein [Prevotella sp.]
MKKKLLHLVRFLKVGIWQISAEDVSPLRFVFYSIIKKLIITIRFFTTKRVMSHASALTYSTLLAIVPILAVVFAIARGFGYNKYIETWFRGTFESQPQAADVIVGFVNSYLVHTKSGIFFGVGLLFMLYTVLMLVSNIEVTFNEIWQVKKQRSIFRTFTDYLAMLLLFPIIIVFTSGLSIFIAAIADNMPDVLLLGPMMRFIISLLPYVLMSAMFIGLYIFMPNTHVKLKSVIVPGILAGVAMQWLQLFYIHSQMWVSSYNAIYGSFAALPLFMLWLQISWTICLFGATLCYANQNLSYYDYNTKTSDISHRYRIMLCALLAARICHNFDSGHRPYTALELRTETGIPIRVVNDLLYEMIDAKLLIEITSDEKGEASQFMPAESINNLSFGVLIDRLESHGRWKIDLPLEQFYNDNWHRALDIRRVYLKNSREILLKDL